MPSNVHLALLDEKRPNQVNKENSYIHYYQNEWTESEMFRRDTLYMGQCIGIM